MTEAQALVSDPYHETFGEREEIAEGGGFPSYLDGLPSRVEEISDHRSKGVAASGSLTARLVKVRRFVKVRKDLFLRRIDKTHDGRGRYLDPRDHVTRALRGLDDVKLVLYSEEGPEIRVRVLIDPYNRETRYRIYGIVPAIHRAIAGRDVEISVGDFKREGDYRVVGASVILAR